jgi:hypothetical protein
MKVKYGSTDAEKVRCSDHVKVSRLKLEDYSCKFLNIEIDTTQLSGKNKKNKDTFHTEVIIPIRDKKDLKKLIKKLQKMESKF